MSGGYCSGASRRTLSAAPQQDLARTRGAVTKPTDGLKEWDVEREALEEAATAFAQAREIGFGKLAAPLRAALAGRSATPSVFDMMMVLGREESLARLGDASDT